MPEGTERVTVSTYVPAAQRRIWNEDAENLGMSQSEFVRTMVQAGRRGFTLEGQDGNRREPDVPRSNPGGSGVKTTVLETLRAEGPLGWADLVEELTADVEDDLESALQSLQAENRIQHSGRRGGYSIVEDPDGE